MQKTIWITGASSGIGEALAINYSRLNANLILSSRNKSKLEDLAKRCKTPSNVVLVAPLDLADNKSFSSVLELVQNHFNKIDVLINNGGLSQRSTVLESNLEMDRRIFEVNYFGTIELTRQVLPWMIRSGGGNITVISSISGKFGFPLRSAYSATKHAVIGFFETLGLEHISDKIHTTIVCPGRIKTNISKHALDGSGKPTGSMDTGLANGMPAEDCAKQIIKAIRKNKRQVLVGRKELLMVYIHKYLPWLFWEIAPKIDPK